MRHAIADITGFLLFLRICENRIGTVPAAEKGRLLRLFLRKLLQSLHLLIHIGKHHQPEPETVLVAVHHLYMLCTESHLIGLHADIVFHIAGAHDEIDGVILKLLVHIADRTFAIGIKSIVYGNRIELLFQGVPPFGSGLFYCGLYPLFNEQILLNTSLSLVVSLQSTQK